MDALLAAAEGVESNRGRFVPTAQSYYLEGYRASGLHASQEQTAVLGLTTENMTQCRRLPLLETLTAQVIDVQEMLITLREQRGFKTAAQALKYKKNRAMIALFEGPVHGSKGGELLLLGLGRKEARKRFLED